MDSPERIVPDETERGIVALHRKRYEFALPYCEGKDVLDAGCGVGYGAALLAGRARRVVAIDRDEHSIAYARRRYTADNVEFRVGDLLALDVADQAIDVACAFEVIEHLPDRDAHLAEIRRVLRADGAYLVSTPRAEQTTTTPANPFHEVELSRADFEQLLLRHFSAVEVYGQRRRQTARHRLMQRLDVLGLRRRLAFLRRPGARILGTPATADLSTDDVVISAEEVDAAQELVAVCRGPR